LPIANCRLPIEKRLLQLEPIRRRKSNKGIRSLWGVTNWQSAIRLIGNRQSV
jgi:hypothetical protein